MKEFQQNAFNCGLPIRSVQSSPRTIVKSKDRKGGPSIWFYIGEVMKTDRCRVGMRFQIKILVSSTAKEQSPMRINAEQGTSSRIPSSWQRNGGCFLIEGKEDRYFGEVCNEWYELNSVLDRKPVQVLKKWGDVKRESVIEQNAGSEFLDRFE